jgi:RNA-directed DNA polymerase
VGELLKAGYVHVVDADLKSYFDTIPKDRLLALVAGKVSDRRVLTLVEAFLEQPVQEGGQQWTPERGTPQGAVISPLLSNIYLDPLDHLMARSGFEMVRGACPCEGGGGRLRGAGPNPGRSGRCPGRGAGLDGASRTDTAPRQDAAGGRPDGWVRVPWVSLRSGPALAAREEPDEAQGHRPGGDQADDGTPPGDGDRQSQSDAAGLVRLLPAQPGADPRLRRGRLFGTLDGWIRRRLRSLLRKQQKRRGIADVRGADQTRWPNRFFADHGLFSLQAAYGAVRQSSGR